MAQRLRGPGQFKDETQRKGREAATPPVVMPEDERIIFKTIEGAGGTQLDPKTAEWLCEGVKDARQRKYLMCLSILGNRSRAARAAGIAYSVQWYWRQEDPAFCAAFVKAMTIASELHEDELFRRASEGVLEPVFQGGQLVGSIRKFDTTALIFALKGAMPEKYADRQKVEHGISEDTVDILRAARERARKKD